MFKLSTQRIARSPFTRTLLQTPAVTPLRLRPGRRCLSHKIEHNPRTYQQLRASVSSTGLSVALLAATFLVIYNFAAPSPRQELAGHLSAYAMESPQLPPGHVGNLSPEQEAKLKQFWKAIFQVSGLLQDGSAQDAADNKAAHHDDKFGLAKQFKQILKDTSPEKIREMVWNMTKCDHPDTLALRFLRARKWDVDKALIMLVSALNWRENEMGVDSDIMKNGEGGAVLEEKSSDGKSKNIGQDFMTQLRMGKSYLHGTDKEGRPICVVRVRLHRNGEQSNESIERYTVHIIETARLVLGKNVETATIVFDMTSFSLANMDYAPVKFMIKCFEANYPESLGAVLIHNSPWIFQGIWRIIRGWLDPVVAGKIHFTSGRAGLEEFIEPSKLAKELGGDEEWEYQYIEPVDGENDLMRDEKAKNDLVAARSALVKDMESATLAWLGDDETNVADAKLKREEIAGLLKSNYWKLDAYVRARSLYDRQGVIGEGGSVNWYS